MVNVDWEYSWSSARAHLGKRYNIIELSDIREYIHVESWRQYLVEKESDELLCLIRERTRKGIMLASLEFIQEMENRLKSRLLPRRRGRPRAENSVCP